MDFVVGLPYTRSQHNMVLVLVDSLTKMAHIVPTTKKANATHLADLFIQNVFHAHGLPDIIVSD